MLDSDLNTTKQSNPPARLRPGRILLYAVLMFFAMVAASIVWRLLRGGPELVVDPVMTAPDVHTSVPAESVSDVEANQADSIETQAPVADASDSATHIVAAASLAPPSLRGTEVDGGIRLVDGRIRADLALRQMFDYFLSALGEMEVDQIRNWLAAYVREQYGKPVVAEALSLFDRYVELGQASARSELASLDPRQRLAALKELRQKLLGPDLAQAFFADEEGYLEYTLDRMDVLKNEQLSSAERSQALGELEAKLPAAIRDSIHHASMGVVAEEQTRELDARGANAATRHAERVALVGKEAADRLATLDQERALWADRVARYKAAYARIQTTPGLSAEVRRQQVEQLLTQSFSTEERARVEALQAVGAL